MNVEKLCFTAAAFLLSFSLHAQITNGMPGRTLVKMLPDYAQPRVYALNEGSGSQPGTLLVLDSQSGAILSEIDVNTNPTDMVLTPAGDAIYVINAGSRTISKVDLATFSVVAEKSITTPNVEDLSNPLHLAVGTSNLVYFTDGGGIPTITTFDYAHGTNIAVYDDGNGAGGICVTREGGNLYRWRQFGWGAGDVNSWVTRYAISNGVLYPQEDSFDSWRRDPTDTPILLDAAEQYVFNKEQMFPATNVSVVVNQFSDNIYAISLDGSVAFGPTEVFNTRTGNVMTNLPFAATVQTLSGDQKRLFCYDSAGSDVVVYDLSAVFSLVGPIPNPTPADGSVADWPLTNLSWTVSPVALSYNVYFGTNASQVAAATPASVQYVGQVSTAGVGLPQAVVPGAIYYWRVDEVGFDSTNSGSIWSFTVSQISVAPSPITVNAIAGYNPPAMNVSLTSTAPFAWLAGVADSSWLSVASTNGNTPASLTLNFNTQFLAPGVYTNLLALTAGGQTLQVLATLSIVPLNLIKMATDLQRPYIYALQAPAQPGQPGQLLIFNTDTEVIERVLPIGVNPTDLAVDYIDNRLYMASDGEDATYVMDLNTQELLPPLQIGTDIYKVNPGPPGTLITEGYDQWINIYLVDATNGSIIASAPWPEFEGDGETGPDGTVYYHCDNGISDAHVHKFAMTNNTFTEVADSLEHPYGTRNLVLSADGTRLFWNSYIYDADLNELGSLGEEIYACTAHGEVALGAAHAFNASNGQVVYDWPVNATVMAVSGDQKKVFFYDPVAAQIDVIPMTSVMSVAGPGLNPNPADGATVNLPLTQLSWTASAFALSYQVYFATNQAALVAASTNSPEYIGQTSSPLWGLSNSLTPGAVYYWRVDEVGFDAVTVGSAWSFNSALADINPASLSFAGVVGLPILPLAASISAPPGVAWSVGVGNPWLTVTPTNGVGPGMLTLQCSTTSFSAGAYTNTLAISAGNLTLTLPVSIDLFDLQASKMVVDRNRDYIYILHPGSGNFNDAFLLFLNTASGVVEKVIPIGSNPTDLSINSFEDRLYVSNWQRQYTRVVDLKTQSEIAPLDIGTDVYRLSAGRAGRLITEGSWEWITIALANTADGSQVATTSGWEGEGLCDPTGNYYYHADWGISDAALTKYYIGGDLFGNQGSASPSTEFGGDTLVMSLDGSRLFWSGIAYDSTPSQLVNLGTEIYACSTNGALAFGSQQVFDTASGAGLYNLPVSSSVMAVDRSNACLWYFDPNSGNIGNMPMRTLYAPSVVAQPEGTTSFVGDTAVLTVQATGQSPLLYQWQWEGTNVVGATNASLSFPNLQMSEDGQYWVIVSNAFGVVTSAVAQVDVVVGSTITSQPQSQQVPVGSDVVFNVTTYGDSGFTYQWLFNGRNLAGATNSTLEFINAAFANVGVYQVVVTGDGGSSVSSNATLAVYNPITIEGLWNETVPAGRSVTFHVTAQGSGPLHYQWMKDDVPLPGQTGASLALRSVTVADVGWYYVQITDSISSSGAGPAFLAVLPPAPTIDSPREGQRFTNTPPIISGRGDPRAGITWVYFILNGANVSLLADGTTNWQIPEVSLQEGENVITVAAENSWGNSPAVTRHFYYSQFGGLTLMTNGEGSILCDLKGNSLEVGKTCHLKAVPGRNQEFAGWTGSITSDSADLAIIMQTGLVLQANFVPSPFVAQAGTYQGLFFEAGAVSPASSGEFRFQLRGDGSMAGKWMLDRQSLALSGWFDTNGSAQLSGAQKDGTPIYVDLQLDSDNGELSGAVSDGSWIASLSGNKAVSASAKSLNTWAGQYTLVLPGSDDGASPFGDSYGVATISKAGCVSISGQMADGSAFSHSSSVSADGTCPFFVPLYRGAGMALGWLNFTENAGSADNLCQWIRPDSGTNTCRAGFTNSLPVSVSPFTPSVTPLLPCRQGAIVLSTLDAAVSVTNRFTLSTSNRFQFQQDQDQLELSINPRNGLLTGGFLHGAVLLHGVILQNQTNAAGFFVQGSESGRLTLYPTY
jgi:hypothetical protein